MNLGYFFLQSANHTGSESQKQTADSLISSISALTNIQFEQIKSQQLFNQPFSVIYVASGGTAGIFKQIAPALKEPVMLLTCQCDNSLSASMEMLSYLKQQGKQGKILHGRPEEIAEEILPVAAAANAKKSLASKRIGMVGAPSDWLISTTNDYSAFQKKLGITTVDISMEEFLLEISKGGYPDCDAVQSIKDNNFNLKEIEKALDVYGALHRICLKYNLHGVSVRCFDLLSSVCSTGCLGLSILNAQGIYGGCEGDLPALVSMMILGEISGHPVFQCNPSRISKNDNKIVFAHCTLPFNMPGRYKLDTHFESGIGVALSGDIPLGQATIFKTSGRLDKYFIAKGEICENMHETNLCRTQIRLRCIDKSVEDFLRCPIGNHYLIANGDYSSALNSFFDILDC